MKTGFIGAGKMAEAMLADILAGGVLSSDSVLACDVSEERRKLMAEKYGTRVTADAREVVKEASLVVLAVKPQDLVEMLEATADAVTSDHLVISIAAGKRLAGLESLWPGARIVRVMPNLAVLASEGMSVFCAGSGVTEADKTTVTGLLSCFGRILELPEEQLDAVTALSGSGPAFWARYHECMVDGAVALGLDRTDAELLSAQTMLGTAKLLLEDKFEADELIRAVTSKKGTTEAGLEVLNAGPLPELVAGTLAAAAARSRELSG